MESQLVLYAEILLLGSPRAPLELYARARPIGLGNSFEFYRCKVIVCIYKV